MLLAAAIAIGGGGVSFIVFAAILSPSPKPRFDWNPGQVKEIDWAMPRD